MSNTTTPVDPADEALLDAMERYHIDKQLERETTPAHL